MTDQEQRQHWNRDDGRWRWAFSLGVSVLLVVVVQAAGVVWWASSITARMTTVEDRQRESEKRHAEQEKAMSAVVVAAGRIEERLDGALRTLERIERQLYNGRGAP